VDGQGGVPVELAPRELQLHFQYDWLPVGAVLRFLEYPWVSFRSSQPSTYYWNSQPELNKLQNLDCSDILQPQGESFYDPKAPQPVGILLQEVGGRF